MDKICIVKLRRNMTNKGAQDRNGAAGGETDAADATVSLALTPEQTRVLQSSPNLLPFFNGAAAKGFASARQAGETIVFQFAFEPIPPMRLMKMEEVVHMLRISKGCLTRIIRQGGLKSYKLGRLRRIMFEDVLSYLEGSREFADCRERASKAKLPQGGIA